MNSFFVSEKLSEAAFKGQKVSYIDHYKNLYVPMFNKIAGSGKRTQWVRALALNPDDLVQFQGPTVEGENQFPKVIL